MVVQKLIRSRLTFMEKISIKDPKTQTSYKVALNNFENYCMEKYGVADYVEKLKEYDEDDLQIKESYERIVAKVYCKGVILNQSLLVSNLGIIDTRYCNNSEFAQESWVSDCN